ncbi:nucleoside-specific channel-forming Tsx family protein [Phocaeicola oris]|uniref:nucleoside-specific channel-forming Tsx family protein n=2 Tax=Phocaeicola TaxID=909656 RepID=UPI00234F66EF|nr:DUF5020 family protein [Phocaeicola oris]MCE2615358.1 DUF5020 family protein [Phocaeicola oris]
MKRYITLLVAILFCGMLSAQNLQFHYDLGHSLFDGLSNRPSVTTTIEMFKPDRWGSTFFFVDLDYYHDGIAGAYWEVARELNVSKNKMWAAHVEYNGGMQGNQVGNYANRFQHAILVGPAWNWHSADFSRTFSLQAMYKYYFKGQNAWNSPFSGFQLTEVWGITFANKACTFSGFCDLWYDPNVNGKWILLSEPQFWYNMNTLQGCEDFNLSIGTEVEISNNFVYNRDSKNNKFYAIPTLAIKWTF